MLLPKLTLSYSHRGGHGRSILVTGLAVFALVIAIACGGPPSSQNGGQSSTSSGSQEIPELSDEMIRERINGARVREVLPESGTGEPVPWGFDEDEPKEITVVDKQMNGTRATIILDIKTQTSPRARNLRYVFGKMKTEWELETGWVLRRWNIVRTENISMKYRDAPKPTPTEPAP
jgi:hypothetical protein